MQTIWVIYDHPADYPDFFVVRPHYVQADGHYNLGTAQFAKTLREARTLIPRGLIKFSRCKEEDPHILESYI